MSCAEKLPLDIISLADAYRSGICSPVEVTQKLLNKIRQEQPRINAFITVAEEQALESARESERRFQTGCPRGVLDGIPYAVKDVIDTKGLPTTMGCNLHKEHVAEKSAFAVQKLEAQGAVMLGKTNTSQYALGATGEISAAGPCCNPHNPAYISGGSSSGSAAAVAAGLCVFALGTDTGGSIRAPASMCGVTSIRPTIGRVSGDGILTNCRMLDTIGVMGNNAADCALVLDVISGYDETNEMSFPQLTPDFTMEINKPVTNLRLGVPFEFFRNDVADYVWAALEEALRVYEKLGVEIVPITMPDIGKYRSVMSRLLMSEAYSVHEENLAKHREFFDPELLERFADGAAVTMTEYIRLQKQHFPFCKEFAKLFENVDAVMLPTQAVTAWKRNGDLSVRINGQAANLYELSSRYLWFTAFAGTAAMNVPCGFHEGLPLGMQLLAPKQQEGILFTLADQYEKHRTQTVF